MEASDWILLVVGLAAIAGVVVALVMSSGLRAAAAHAAADMVTKWHERDVAIKKAKLAKLRQRSLQNADTIGKLNKQLDAKRAKLKAKYEDTGATADEVVGRLDRLGL